MLARRRFADRDPIGERVRVGPTDGPWSTIIGVVGDIKQSSLAVTDTDAVYVPTTQWFFADNPLWLVVRAGGDAAAFAPAIREAIWSVDTAQPIVRVATMETLVAESAPEQRFALVLFEAFAFAALMLATVGIYGILSGSVSERTREIAIRSALGASRRAIVAMVLREGLLLTGLGVAIGFVAAMGLTGALATLLFGVSRFDPVTYGGVIAVLLGVAGVASALPACRAAWVDPSITLRMD
jgi:putative ABC transport system permease protein